MANSQIVTMNQVYPKCGFTPPHSLAVKVKAF